MRFYNRIAIYDDFGGLGFEEESNKMAAAIGNNRSMLLANHGILTVGETVADAFDELYYFEKACETYITALSTNKELNLVEPKIAEKMQVLWDIGFEGILVGFWEGFGKPKSMIFAFFSRKNGSKN